ncbi:cyclic AMP-dependent transcription factor ATF-4-like [Anneissia japonica]|uniref:cyclic AMP-dependent transcription factor ATF-4-like n=1 Tax=Anneissia japonica TaxID=1529436 RepID=UPI0014258DFA|nr:cyclic AMP-dependent transcription factor ATF-4-like [Anneissia japonica]
MCMMTTTMDYDQWMFEEELELFSPHDQKVCVKDVQDDMELSDLIGPAGNLLDQLDSMYPTDDMLFPKWMSEKVNLNFLEDIQELSDESVADIPPLLPPLEVLVEKDGKSELSDLDLLNQLVAESVSPLQPLPIQETNTQEDSLADALTEFSNDEVWEAVGATSGLSSATSSEDVAVFVFGSPESPENMDAPVFSPGSPDSEEMALFAAGSPASSVCSSVSDNPISPLSTIETKAIEPKPSKSRARSVLKTASGTVKPSRKERKKDQNKQAATRYREKKRSLAQSTKCELDGLEKRNVELKDTVESMTKEIKYLKDLLQEVLAVKGQLKEMGHKKK